MAYWFNVRTGQVERDEERSRMDDVMGPYETREDAEHAYERARQRTQEWDEEDRRWEEGEDPEPR